MREKGLVELPVVASAGRVEPRAKEAHSLEPASRRRAARSDAWDCRQEHMVMNKFIDVVKQCPGQQQVDLSVERTSGPTGCIARMQ